MTAQRREYHDVAGFDADGRAEAIHLQDLGATFTDVQWVIDAYTLTLAAFVLTSGSLGDRLGRRRVFALGLIIFALASLSCRFAVSLAMLNISRAVQGVGGAVLFAVSLALIA